MASVCTRLILFCIACCAALLVHADAGVQQKRILLLYAYGYGGRGVELFSDGFFKAISEAGFPVNNVHAEYLDLQRNQNVAGYRQDLFSILQKKYAQRQIDLIVTVQQPALEFLLTDGKAIAPGAPVITLQNRPLLEAEKAGRRIIGEINQFDIKGTLEHALELFPQTQQVVFVSGSSEADIKLANEAARMAAPWQNRVNFEYTTGMGLDDILQKVAHLPPNSSIIFTQYNVDSKGRVALAYEAENMLVKAANAPVFGFYDYNLRNGGIGGSVIPVEASGIRTGQLAMSILTGATTLAAGTLLTNENVPMFDWQQIQRWGGDASRLPANTIFINRSPSVWQQYGVIIVAMLLFVAGQSVLIAVFFVNIRRRKRAEFVLRENEAKFHAIFDGIFDSVIFADTQRRIQLVNPAFTRIFGYTANEVAGRTTEFIYADPADYAEQGQLRFNPVANGGAGTYELRYRRKDGSTFWAESNGTRIMTPDGQILGLMGMHRDITERKHAQMLQKESDENIKRLVHDQKVILDSSIVSFVKVKDRHYIWANQAFTSLFGYTQDEVIGQSTRFLYADEQSYLAFAEAAYPAIQSGEMFRGEVQFRCKDGSLRWCEVCGEGLYPGSNESIWATVDITEKRQFDQALRESEERLRLALDATSDGLWDWDLRSGVVYRSPRYYELANCQATANVSNFEFFKSIVHPDDLPRALETIEAHKQGKTAAIEFDFRLASTSGEEKWMGVRGRIIERDENGAPLRIMGTMTDITARKQAENEIQRLNTSLEQRVEQRTAELTAANQELDSFAYAVSHDLRAPLRAMKGFAQALQEDYGDRLEGEAKTWLDQIGIASRKMGELIEGILALSRSTRGNLQCEPVDLSALAASIVAELARTELERIVATEIEPGLVLHGDGRMIEAVMRNLLGNAWKYTGKTPAPAIRIHAGEIDGQRAVCVADNGAGFDMAHAGQLFQPFRRLHREDEFPGIGIGLATVQRIVHRHGGKITVQAKPGKGATFCFTLAEKSGVIS